MTQTDAGHRASPDSVGCLDLPALGRPRWPLLGCRCLVSLLLCLSLCFGLGGGLGGRGQVARADSLGALQPYLERMRRQITEFQLDNGMTFIVLERHQAPVVSFVTYANVGGVDEPPGKTGVAHFLEHLAFKGTTTIGTTDYLAEAALLAQMDEAFDQLKALQKASDSAKRVSLEQRFAALQQQANRYVRQNELGQVIERKGGVGLNATTSADATTYFYSLPSNKLELWMSLESERFLNPVFREFYEEKNVILEERRMRLENDPVSQLFEAVKAKAFRQHPYGRPVIGEVEDIVGLSRQDVQDFFDVYYGPDNLTCAIVGDVDPDQVKRLAETYFGRYGSRVDPARRRSIVPEPAQRQEKVVEMTDQTQPWYLEAYRVPGREDPTAVIYGVMADILSSGRTSRLYRSLVESQQVALAAQGFTGYPGDRYENLMVFYGLVAPNHRIDEVETALHAELEQLQREPVAAAELARVKTQLKASVMRSLTSNQGMGQVLAEYRAKTGRWQTLFDDLERINALTPADLQRVARQTFRPENRTVGRLFSRAQAAEPEAMPQAGAGAGAEAGLELRAGAAAPAEAPALPQPVRAL